MYKLFTLPTNFPISLALTKFCFAARSQSSLALSLSCALPVSTPLPSLPLSYVCIFLQFVPGRCPVHFSCIFCSPKCAQWPHAAIPFNVLLKAKSTGSLLLFQLLSNRKSPRTRTYLSLSLSLLFLSLSLTVLLLNASLASNTAHISRRNELLFLLCLAPKTNLICMQHIVRTIVCVYVCAMCVCHVCVCVWHDRA